MTSLPHTMAVMSKLRIIGHSASPTAEAACDCESTGLNWGPFPSKLGASQLRLFVGLFWALLRVTVFGGFQSCEATMRSAFKFEFE